MEHTVKKTLAALVVATSIAAPLMPLVAHADKFEAFDTGWHGVSQEGADVLSETGYRQADTYPWEDCVIHYGPRAHSKVTLVCPDGFTARWSR